MAESIAERIRALREARGWSKLELARRIGGKNPRTVVYRWEAGKTTPDPNSIAKLAEIFTAGGEESVHPEDIDPHGEAGKRKPRRALQKSRTSADSDDAALSQAGTPGFEVFMDTKSLLAIPDAELFQKVLGVWLSLDSHVDRVGFIDHARGYGGVRTSARTKNHRR